jgi:hypothetical protein
MGWPLVFPLLAGRKDGGERLDSLPWGRTDPPAPKGGGLRTAAGTGGRRAGQHRTIRTGSFYAGLLGQSGYQSLGEAYLDSWTSLLDRYPILPEGIDPLSGNATSVGNALRPEYVDSAFNLWLVTAQTERFRDLDGRTAQGKRAARPSAASSTTSPGRPTTSYDRRDQPLRRPPGNPSSLDKRRGIRPVMTPSCRAPEERASLDRLGVEQDLPDAVTRAGAGAVLWLVPCATRTAPTGGSSTS